MSEPQPTGAALVRAIIREVAERHGLTPEDLTGPSQKMEVYAARREAVIEAHERTSFSHSQLGRLFGGRCHTTILNTLRSTPRVRQPSMTDADRRAMRRAAENGRLAQALGWRYGPERAASILQGTDAQTNADVASWNRLGARSDAA